MSTSSPLRSPDPRLAPARRRTLRDAMRSWWTSAAPALPLPTHAPVRLTPLLGRDYLLLLVYGLILAAFPLAYSRTLSTHETVHCVNVREMQLDGDWIIPHYGGRPWLERPPLPFWLTLPAVKVFGADDRAYRVAPLLVSLACILLAGWIASVWFGRATGVLSGLILATIREFTHYSLAPECDMFLCGVITSAMALFVYLEFRRRSAEGESGFLWGHRPLALLLFFVVLGLANLVKGLVFGDLLILVPIAAYLLLGGERWSMIRRYVWLPGWLAFAVVGSAWAAAAWWRYPDVVELWKSDYVGRLNEGYMREPIWYYLLQLPWVLFPWTICAAIGLALTWRQVWRAGRTPERFLWCWALAPIAFLSIPEGKHHHYLLHALVPWAILAALGLVRLARYLPTLEWMRTPWPTLLVVGIPGEIALAVVLGKYPGAELLAALMVLWPAAVLAFWWSMSRRNMLHGLIAWFALLVVCHWAGYLHPVLFERRYEDDLAFLEEVRSLTPADSPLLVMDAKGPLDASWLLHHLHGRGRLLHNLSFLRCEPVDSGELYLIARGSQVHFLSRYGVGQLLAQSRHSRYQATPDDRYGLYRLRLHAGLVRRTEPVYISPMQATGREPGPYLR
jgi:4-amino-4-deoxy-L-arabinose transferase-like glycosyltransferase